MLRLGNTRSRPNVAGYFSLCISRGLSGEGRAISQELLLATKCKIRIGILMNVAALKVRCMKKTADKSAVFVFGGSGEIRLILYLIDIKHF